MAVQWSPSHYGIPGNKAVGVLSTVGGRLPQTDTSTTCVEAVTLNCKGPSCVAGPVELPPSHSRHAYTSSGLGHQDVLHGGF